jgi:hypothetical protein
MRNQGRWGSFADRLAGAAIALAALGMDGVLAQVPQGAAPPSSDRLSFDRPLIALGECTDKPVFGAPPDNALTFRIVGAERERWFGTLWRENCDRRPGLSTVLLKVQIEGGYYGRACGSSWSLVQNGRTFAERIHWLLYGQPVEDCGIVSPRDYFALSTFLAPSDFDVLGEFQLQHKTAQQTPSSVVVPAHAAWTFEPWLTVGTSGRGGGEVRAESGTLSCNRLERTCWIRAGAGRTVQLTATPYQGSVFAGWSGACQGLSPTISVAVGANAACTATFEPAIEIGIYFSGAGRGTVTSEPPGIRCTHRDDRSCRAVFPQDSAVTLRAEATAGVAFAEWSGACQGTTPTTTVRAVGNLGCGAKFEARPTLTVAPTGDGLGRIVSTPAGIDCGAGGVGACSAQFSPTAVVTLRATPAVGSQIAGWTGACSGGSTEVRTSLTVDTACGARFDSIKPESGWWWSPSAPGGGYSLERQGDRLLLAAYLYREDGSPLWYLGRGTLNGGPVEIGFEEFRNGQTLSGPWRGAQSQGTAGRARLTFTQTRAATLEWTGREGRLALARFQIPSSTPESPVSEAATAPEVSTPAGSIAPAAALDRLRTVAGAQGSVRVILTVKPSRPTGGTAANGLAAPSIADRQAAVDSAARSFGGAASYRSPVTPIVVARLPAMAIDALAQHPDVESVHEDELTFPSLAESVPRIRADRAAELVGRGQGWTVAIVDTGIDTAHSFFAGRIVDEACFSTNDATSTETTARSNCPNGEETQLGPGAGRYCTDLAQGCYHGTHVAGIAAGAGASSSGVAPAAGLVGIQVFSMVRSSLCARPGGCLGAYTSDLIRALDHAYLNAGRWRLAAVNMSLGSTATYSSHCDTDPKKPAIDNLRAIGVATVIASGNSGSRNGVSSPACISSAIPVGSSLDTADRLSTFSARWSLPMVVAPGESIVSADVGGGFRALRGTSMAAPHVAGAWAVLRAGAPQAGVGALFEALRSTGVAIRETNDPVAYPRIDVAAALDAASVGPETGWWWNANQSGRGFFLEAKGRRLFASAYVYDDAGNAVWYVSDAALIQRGVYQGSWQRYSGGQTPGGVWRTPRYDGVVGSLTLRFSDPRNATLTLPTGAEIVIGRFGF